MIVVLGIFFIDFVQDYQFLNKGFFLTRNPYFRLPTRVLDLIN